MEVVEQAQVAEVEDLYLTVEKVMVDVGVMQVLVVGLVVAVEVAVPLT